MFITLQVGRCNVLVMGNNKTTNSPYNVMAYNLSLGRSMLKLHCIWCVFDHCLGHGEPISILGPIIIVWMLCVVWTWFCFFGEIWHVLRQRIWSRSEGRLQRESKNDSQARSSSSKPIIVLKPLSVEGTPQLQHLNLVFNLQDSPDHKKYEDSITVAKGEGHQNTEEPTSTQELLNTMVASQIQLKEDMNLMVQ